MRSKREREPRCGPAAGGRSVALPVLDARDSERAGAASGKGAIRRSKSGKRRAMVLAAVHAVIGAHILLWVVMGMTLSPVEPSEAMYTLEQGLVNAGFVFFVLALVSTLVFGRFFCGWGCHVVALQDLCGWVMKKCGVHPKPFRTRLLALAPVVLALYMFVWPTVRREVIVPLAGERWAALEPWLGRAGPRPRVQEEFFVEDFWATFPPWYVAIPFLSICGFATVYFLGSKGFCTYGCPYGGFFGPADRIAPGRILVNDNCEGCGHCTAVCTSNVRVHEEVRTYGMVVDPGCMKCLDCVSVCPNEALRFGFAAPPVVNKKFWGGRSGRPRKNYDLSLGQEAWVGAVFFALVVAFREMLNSVPLLMAVGMGAIGAFAAWKLYSMVRVPNVRLQSLQLKIKGRVTGTGAVFVAFACVLLIAGAWSGAVRYQLWRANAVYEASKLPTSTVLSAAYTPDEEEAERALRAIGRYKLAGPPSEGGYGWPHTPKVQIRIAYLSAVAGRLDEAEAWLVRALHRQEPTEQLVRQYVQIMAVRGASPEQVEATLKELLVVNPESDGVRMVLAGLHLQFGRTAEGVGLLTAVLRGEPKHVETWAGAAELMLHAGARAEAEGALREAARRFPKSSRVRYLQSAAAALAERPAEAEMHLREAIRQDPGNPDLHRRLAMLLDAAGRPADARKALAEAERLERERTGTPGSGG